MWRVRMVTNSTQNTLYVSPARQIHQVLLPGECLAVCAEAVFGDGLTKPLGTLWPYLETEGVCLLDPAGGLCAELAIILARWNYDLGSFNWRRLYEVLEGAEVDYWDLDLYELAKAILERKFRVDMVTKKQKQFEIIVQVPPYLCVPASPNKPIFTAGTIEKITLAAGTHTWFYGMKRLVVQLDNKGRYTVSY